MGYLFGGAEDREGESGRFSIKINFHEDLNDNVTANALVKSLQANETEIFTRRRDLKDKVFNLKWVNGVFFLYTNESEGRTFSYARIEPILYEGQIKDYRLDRSRNADFILRFKGLEGMIGISPHEFVE